MKHLIKSLALLSAAVLPLAANAATTSPVAQSSAIAQSQGKTNDQWWPNRLDLTPLRQMAPRSNPYGEKFDYAAAFNALDLAAVKKDIAAVLTSSQPWWPADYGNYGPFFIRLAWHGAGTYRMSDGRGGSGGSQQRFEALNSWPDNVNLDKARRLVWPIKQKYGRALSWGDLMELSGNVALEQMGFKTIGFAGGRVDDWEADNTYWGPETTMLTDERHAAVGEIRKPLAASQMGLIYVNPEGPNGNSDPIGAAKEIRATFGNMGMNDAETVALIAGGHSFGKSHGAHAQSCKGVDPTSAGVEQQGFGYNNHCGTGHGADTVGAGPEGAWTSDPTTFTAGYLNNLFNNDWVLVKGVGGAHQWQPKVITAATMTPDAADASKKHPLMMFTTDIALKTDPAYRPVAQNFKDHPEQFADAFAQAWFKLLHRDMGPRARYLGSDVPKEEFIWQDPLPIAPTKTITPSEVATLKAKIMAAGIPGPALIRTAWASAATFRKTDFRGGTNGARVRLEPQIHWLANSPQELPGVLQQLTAVQTAFNAHASRQVSLADVVVLGGNAAVEAAAAQGGMKIAVPFMPGRVDAAQGQTDVSSFAALEPTADGFRNFYKADSRLAPAQALVDRAQLLDLTVPEMTVLVGGMRALDANAGGSHDGVLTDRPGTLSNDFFVNLLDMKTAWVKSPTTVALYEGHDRASGKLRWTATPVDLVFGSNAELRAVAEVYGSNDGQAKFMQDFVSAWSKVMNLDRAPTA